MKNKKSKRACSRLVLARSDLESCVGLVREVLASMPDGVEELEDAASLMNDVVYLLQGAERTLAHALSAVNLYWPTDDCQ